MVDIYIYIRCTIILHEKWYNKILTDGDIGPSIFSVCLAVKLRSADYIDGYRNRDIRESIRSFECNSEIWNIGKDN